MKSYLLPIVAVFCLACGGATATSQAPNAPSVAVTLFPTQTVSVSGAQVATPATRPTVAPPTAVPAGALRIGDIARQGQIWMVVVRVDNPAKPGQFAKIDQGNKAVLVEVIMGNDGDTPITASSFDGTLVDDGGFAAKSALFGSDFSLPTVTLNKGERVRGEVAFQVPEASKPAMFRMRTALIGGGTLESGLQPAAGAPSLPPHVVLDRPRAGDLVEKNGSTLTVVTLEPAAKASQFSKVRTGYKMVAV